MPPGVDDDLEEVGAFGRQELSEAGEVKVDFGVASQDALDASPGVGIAGAPASDRSVSSEGAGIGGADAEVGEHPLGDIADEGAVKAPAGDLAGVGEGADGGGADVDLDGGIGAGGEDGEQGEERQGGKRRKNAEGSEEGVHHARLRTGWEQDKGGAAG